MTSFLIGYPDIPISSITITPTEAFAEDNQVENLITGHRYLLGKLNAASATSPKDIVFDLGSDSNNHKPGSYIIIGRADILKNANVTQLDVSRSSNGSLYTSEYNDSSFNSATLYGPRSEDYIGTFTETSNYRYWRVRYTVSGSSGLSHSKVYLGTLFDFEVEPADYDVQRQPAEITTFTATDGSKWVGKTSDPVYRVSLRWEFVTDDKVTEFNQKINKRKAIDTYFLYTATQTEVLDEKTLIHCQLLNARTERVSGIADCNTVYAEFVEVLG